jgi:hypothetical protein
MAVEKYTLVSYDGTDIGAIYLEDIGKRKQLGGGDQFIPGQDLVVNKGDVVALVNSGPVLLSQELGILKRYSDAGSLTLIPSEGVTGVVRTGVGTKADPASTQGDF